MLRGRAEHKNSPAGAGERLLCFRLYSKLHYFKIVIAAIEDIIHIYGGILNLINCEVKIFYIHSAIFIRREKRGTKNRIAIRHIAQGMQSGNYFVFSGGGSSFVYLSQKAYMRAEHTLCPFRNDDCVFFIVLHALCLRNYFIEVTIQFRNGTAGNTGTTVFFCGKKFFFDIKKLFKFGKSFFE